MHKTYYIITPVFPDGIAVYVERLQYANKNLAIVLRAPDGEPIFRASANIDSALPEHYFVCKNYTENEGLDLALEKAGIAKRTGATIRLGWCTCPIMELEKDA